LEHHQQSDGKTLPLRRLLFGTSAVPAAALATVMFAAPLEAHADLIWTFSGVTVADTKTAVRSVCGIGTGCYVHVSGTLTVTDDSVPSIVSYNISTSATGPFPAMSWTDSNSYNNDGLGPNNLSLVSNAQPSTSFVMTFGAYLNGNVNPDPIGFAALSYAGSEPINGEFGPTVGDVVLGQSMPEPSSLTVLSAGLGMLATRRRRTRKK
jgi:hypothetical protein